MIRRTLAVAALLTPLVYSLAVASPASQAITNCGSSGVSSNGLGISTFVCIYLNGTPVSPSQTTPAPGQAAPPVCWLEPQYTPADLKTYVTTEAGLPESIVAEGAKMYGEWLQYYGTTVQPAYELPLQGKGMWWGVGCDSSNLNASTYAEQIWNEVGLGVFHPWEWELAPPAPAAGVTVVSGALLAEYARDAFSPPQPKTETSPVATQTVGLTTYFAGTTDTTQHVKASLPNAGLTEDVVGTPEKANIDITTVTASGATVDTTVSCPVTTGAATATYGVVNADNAPAASACSYTPTQPGTSTYTVTITWSWNWLEADGAAGWPLTTLSPVEQVGPLNVQEVQAINNN
jgi:hypothetical protein